jgi:hypothetical protein
VDAGDGRGVLGGQGGDHGKAVTALHHEVLRSA